MLSPAAAHTSLESASPGPGDTVATGSDVLALTFEGELAPDGTHEIELRGPDDKLLAVGTPTIAGADTMCARSVAMQPGVHTLVYHTTSSDGHPIRSRYTFEVADTGDPVDPGICADQQLAEPTASGQDSDLGAATAPTILVWGSVGAAVLVLGVTAFWLVRRRNRGQPER